MSCVFNFTFLSCFYFFIYNLVGSPSSSKFPPFPLFSPSVSQCVSVMTFPKSVILPLKCLPAIPLLGIYSKDLQHRKVTYTTFKVEREGLILLFRGLSCHMQYQHPASECQFEFWMFPRRCAWKGSERWSEYLDHSIQVGDHIGSTGFWLRPHPALAATIICGVN